MDFEPTLEEQLNNFIGETVQIATDNNLIEGELILVANGVIQVAEEVNGYERETQTVFIPISSVNFVRVF